MNFADQFSRFKAHSVSRSLQTNKRRACEEAETAAKICPQISRGLNQYFQQKASSVYCLCPSKHFPRKRNPPAKSCSNKIITATFGNSAGKT